MSDETPSVPDAVTDFQAAIDKRRAQWKAEDSKKEQPSAPVPTEKAPEAETTPVPENKDQAADKGEETPPEAPDSSGPSSIPESIRSKLPNLSKEALDYFETLAKEKATVEKSYAELRKEFTQKTQLARDVEKAAENWKRIEDSPEALQALAELNARRAQAEAKPEDDAWDFTEHTSAENKAYLRRMAAEVAREQAEGVLKARVLDPAERKREVGAALAQFAIDNKIPRQAMEEALVIADEHAREIGAEWTAKNAVGLAKVGLAMIVAKNPPARNGAPGLQTVASPQSRSVGVSSQPIPSWKRDGAKGPRNDKERVEHFRAIARSQYGQDVTIPELDRHKAE